MLSRFPKSDPIWEISNPRIVQRKAKELLGKDTIIYRSNMKMVKHIIKTNTSSFQTMVDGTIGK